MRTISKYMLRAVFACTLATFCSLNTASESDTARGEHLLAFVGQKIRLSEQKTAKCSNCIVMDSHYVATYRVLNIVYGIYRDDVISFDVYDHYGAPGFSQFDTVLLFVSRQADGKWMHEKYQFFDLYRGTDGQWYGCGDPYGGMRVPHRKVHARPVRFVEPVSYPLAALDRAQIERYYPAKYFKIRDGRAFCVLGTSVKDLFQAKKETVLTARGIFK